jgi:two-component system OmpR family response regulator
MLPLMNGLEVCKTLRNETDIPIIFLSARADEIDRVVGLEIGADDYVVKPFSMRELLVRVKTRLKVHHQLHDLKAKEQSASHEEKLIFDNLVIDPVRHEVMLDGAPLQLKPKEFELLAYLVENQGRALTRELILDKVWGWDFVGESRTVDVHVRWLRSKIEKNVDQPTRIITVRGSGYRFEG